MWDKCINATPGQSGLLSITDSVAEGYICFNCGKKGLHKKENCPEPINKKRPKLERDKFNLEKGRGPRHSTKFNNRGKPIPHKWRASEEEEQNKRVIDKLPYTYNPVIKGWERGDTPATGLPTANLTTAQIEMEELEAENECLKTDRSTDRTPEQSINYTRNQMLLNTKTQYSERNATTKRSLQQFLKYMVWVLL